MLGVGLVVAPGEQDHARAGKAGEVVDVPVGLVLVDAAAQPDHLARTDMVEQRPLDLLAGEPGVAISVQQALFGRDHGALAVDVDRAALEHDRSTIAVCTFYLEDLPRDALVAVPGEEEAPVKAPPRIEVPVDAPQSAAADHEGRARVAHPGVVG